MPRRPTLLLLAALLGMPATAAACPNCAAGRAARASVFDRDFGRNLLTALAPFLVIGVVAGAAHRSGARPRPGAASPPLPDPSPAATPSAKGSSS